MFGRNLFAGARYCALLAVCLFHSLAFSAIGPRERALYNFAGIPDGVYPASNLVADARGHFYGTTVLGGTGTCIQSFNGPSVGCGIVFEITPPASPGAQWREKVLYSFQAGNDGALPQAGLVLDKSGNLYGTTSAGGSGANCSFAEIAGCGTVFRLSPPASQGAAWTEEIIYAFQGIPDGATPLGTLAFDEKGRLYGATYVGGNGICVGYTAGCGEIFRLTPPASGNGAWTEATLYSFNGSADGADPAGGLVFDNRGNLYGTTSYGGGGGCDGDWNDDFCGGIVFELSPPGAKSGAWTETVLVTFYGLSDGATFPGASLTLDKHGNLYGTTLVGGSGNCNNYEEWAFPSCGTVFQLSPPNGQNSWTYTPIYTFIGTTDGAYPGYFSGTANLALDTKGDLYGTTPSSGNQPNCQFLSRLPDPGCGTVWKLTPPSTVGGAWTETTLHVFAGGSDGGAPFGGVYLKDGVLFGTTSGQFGISATNGTVFALVP